MLRGRSYAPARLLARATLTATLLCGIALAQAPVASAEEVVNVTLNIPADPRPNPCAAGDLVSRSGTDNLVMGYTIHTTVSAQGVPTAQVTDIRLQCTG
jgi:hypothetical protein